MRAADLELLDTLGPVVLVVHLGNDHLGCASESGGAGCARPTMVDDRGDPLEERLLVDLADDQAVGCVVGERQIGPAPGYDRPAPSARAAAP